MMRGERNCNKLQACYYGKMRSLTYFIGDLDRIQYTNKAFYIFSIQLFNTTIIDRLYCGTESSISVNFDQLNCLNDAKIVRKRNFNDMLTLMDSSRLNFRFFK